MKIKILILVLLTGCALFAGRQYLPANATTRVWAESGESPRVQDWKGELQAARGEVASLNPAGLPVSLEVKSATEADGRGLSTVTYSLKNNTASVIDRIQLRVYVINSQGHLVGGEGWIQGVKVKPEMSNDITTVLRNKVSQGDRVIALLESVSNKAGAWTVAPFNLSAVLKTYLESGANELPPAAFRAGQTLEFNFDPYQDMGGTGGTYCSNRLQEARDACGSGGIASFTCNPSTGAWGFACR